MIIKRISYWSFFTLIVAVALVTGCGHYQFGTTLPVSLRDVYVPSVRNESDQPSVEHEVTRALLSEIRREGTMRIVPENRASARLDVVVVTYKQDSIRYNRGNSELSEEYRMVLRANATFTDLNATDPDKIVVLDRVLDGDATFLRGIDTITAMQSCLPEAAKDLAQRIVDACVSAW